MKKIFFVLLSVLLAVTIIGCSGNDDTTTASGEVTTTLPPSQSTTTAPTEVPTTVPPIEDPTTVPPVEDPTTTEPIETPTTPAPTYSVTYKATAGGYISGTTQQSGQSRDGSYTFSPVTAVASPGYVFKGWSDGKTESGRADTLSSDKEFTAIFEIQPLSLPIFEINTENAEPILSKEIYVKCGITVSNTEEGFTLDNEAGKIKGRGNTSWKNNKKPYNLKFDEPVDLFGNGAAKGWAIISNHTDYSLIRNYLAYSVGAEFSKLGGIGQMQFVDLYVNGQYDGVYMICEQIEIHENRINISTSEELDTGYIVELDGRGEGDCFVVDNKYYAMKGPDDYTKAQKNYIGMYVLDCVNALKSEDWEAITSLLDVESFAESYIVHETHKCCDVGYASFYLIKDKGGKLQSGPMWDFDRSLGNVYNKAGSQDANKLFASYESQWYAYLLKHEEFVQLVCEKLAEYAPIMEETYKKCFDYVEAHSDSFIRNDTRWGILGTDLYPNPSNLVNTKTWQGQVEHNKKFLEDSLKFMLETYSIE